MNDKKNQIKIIVLGDSNVGKSKLINRFIDNYYSDSYYKTYSKKLILI